MKRLSVAVFLAVLTISLPSNLSVFATNQLMITGADRAIPGQIYSVAVRIDQGTIGVRGVQFDLTFDQALCQNNTIVLQFAPKNSTYNSQNFNIFPNETVRVVEFNTAPVTRDGPLDLVTITCIVNNLPNGSTVNLGFTGIELDDGNGNEIGNPTGGTKTVMIVSGQVQVQADLSITESANPDPAIAGDQLIYTLRINNAGPDTAHNVQLTDTLPSTVTFSDAETVQGQCSASSGTIMCDIGNIVPTSNVTITITVAVDSNAPSNITNTVMVSSNTTDPNSTNNSASEQTTVNSPSQARADLSITESANPDPAIAGDQLIYTLRINNAGPDTAHNVQLTEILPSSVTLSSVSSSQGGCTSLPCNLGTVVNGKSATVTLTIIVNPNATGFLINNVRVSSNTTDPNSTNNSASEQTTVNSPSQARADLSIAESFSGATVSGKPALVYTLGIDNAGPNTAHNVHVTDALSSQVTFVTVQSAQGTCLVSSGIVSCDVGDMLSGAKIPINITVTIPSLGFITNNSTVSSSTADPNSTNNSARVDIGHGVILQSCSRSCLLNVSSTPSSTASHTPFSSNRP